MNAHPAHRVDPLTVAYVGLGAIAVFDEASKLAPRRYGEVSEGHGGRVGLVEEVVAHAWRLEAVYAAVVDRDPDGFSHDFQGFAESIGETFGQRYAQAMLDHPADADMPAPDRVADAIAAALFDQEFIEGYTPEDYPELLAHGQRVLGFVAPTQDQVEAEHQRLNQELSAGDGDYDDGYRDALQSTLLALAQEGMPMKAIQRVVNTALDAFANNVPSAEKRF